MLRLLCLLLPVFVMASEVDIAKTDIIERTINFVIFIVILWYLTANKIKMALKNRQDEISNKLNIVQERLKQSNIRKQEALKELEDTKQKAREIILNAKKEAEIITENIYNQCKNDIISINNSHQDKLYFEQKRMKKAVIDDVINELLANDDIKLTKNDYIDILLKRIS